MIKSPVLRDYNELVEWWHFQEQEYGINIRQSTLIFPCIVVYCPGCREIELVEAITFYEDKHHRLVKSKDALYLKSKEEIVKRMAENRIHRHGPVTPGFPVWKETDQDH